HSKYKRWLIFSDLHVMPSTLTTCIQVLNYVHTTALQYDAGILFLGDFWHHRGFVRVDCLNAVLAELSKWTVPCIMLPGNHDQISWKDGGGETKQLLHPGPLIFSHPTKFKDALFVPHIRDKSTMKAVLSSKEAINSSALFVHADVKGASMNDLIKSQHGLSASFFPSDRYVYSGHFHKPHFVQLSKKYVGSPYQTSLSEAGQSKSLILVDSEQNWKCVEEIPIDIGRRYHRITDIVRAEQDSSVSKDGARGNSSFDIRVDELRSAGIAVDIRDVQMRPNEGGDGASLSEQATGANAEDAVALEELSPFATLKAYLNSEVASGAMGEETRKKLLTEGELMLKELSEDALQNGGLAPIVNTATMTHIELDSVVIAGFGSFPLLCEMVHLSVLNGVGKSTLAMASLWALVGSVDPRPAQDGKVADVVNDFSKSAEVTLSGSLNSKPFVVKRSKTLTSGSLSFMLDGTDLTRQSAKDTQVLIHEYFQADSQVLMRTIFHGQHSIGSLLESTDAKLKDELSYLISLDVYQQAASLARSRQRDHLRKSSELDGMISIRMKDAARASDKIMSAEEDMNRKTLLMKQQIMKQHETELELTVDVDVDEAMTTVQIQLDEYASEIKRLEEELSKIAASDNDEISRLQSHLDEKRKVDTMKMLALQSAQRNHDIATMQLASEEKQLQNVQSEWNISSLSPDNKCQTCGQSILSSEAHQRVKNNINEKLLSATIRVEEADHKVSCNAEISGKELQLSSERLREAEKSLASKTNELREVIKEARLAQATLSSDFSILTRKSRDLSEYKISQSRAEADLNRLNDALSASIEFYESCRSESERIQTNIAELREEKEALASKGSFSSLLVDTFGSKGVQAFVLYNVVKSLQQCSQYYLDELSEGSLQLNLEVGTNDSILKQAAVRNLDGSWRSRPLSSLSGGQWRRCSLALSLGFVDLAYNRGRLQSSLLVLDEPLTHLDSDGRASVGRLLRKMLKNGS
ncbi:ABC transporter, partial [Thalassiosira pseudonana CCMP1335]